METTYWIVIDNRPRGPYSIEALREQGLTPQSMVWREGLPDWVRAETLPELSLLFDGPATPAEPQVVVAETAEVYVAQPQAAGMEPTAEAVEPCPPTYLGWSIAATILCCTPLGIAAIIFSAQVKNSYGRGLYEKARKQSEWAQWMIILAITLGLIFMPFQMALMG